jgi:glycogen debranching enzyme
MKNHFRLLERYLKARAATCVHGPDGRLPRRFVTPSTGVIAGADDSEGTPARSTVGHYQQMYDWDACFFAQVAHLLGIKDLVPDVVLNFLALQEGDGHIPRTVSPLRIWDKGDQAKPFFCQALAAYLKANRRQARTFLTAEVIDKLGLYLSFFENHRRHACGLYRWRNVLESGVDDNLALIHPTEAARDENVDLGNFHDGMIVAVDASTYVACEMSAFAWLARTAGRPELAAQYESKAADLTALIEEKLWDEELKMYVNFNPETGTHVKVRSWTGLTPVCLGIARADRARACIEHNILNKEHFLRKAGIVSYAVSERLHNQSRRGLYGRNMVSNWQGPVWVLVNALACRGLVHYGYKKDAVRVAKRILATLEADVVKNGTLHENYNAESGAPLFAPDFMSWNALAIEMIRLVRESERTKNRIARR